MFIQTRFRASKILLALLVLMLSALLPAAAFSAEITLAWDKPVDSDISGYRIYFGESGTAYKNSPYTEIDSPSQTSTVIFGLEDGVTYSFAATCIDGHGQESGFSEAVTYTVPELTRVTLAWDKPSGSNDLAGYNLYFGEPGTDFKDSPYKTIDSPDQTSSEFSGLESGRIYAFVATSLDTDGRESVFSEELYYNVAETTTDNEDEDGSGTTDPGADDTESDSAESGSDTGDDSGSTDGGGDSEAGSGDESAGGDDPADNTQTVIAIVFETGEVEVNHEWAYVSFSNTYTDPIVVANPMSRNGGSPGVVRVRNVDGDGFELRVQEWDYLGGWHNYESIGYIVMEKGSYELADGTLLEAGTFYTDDSVVVGFSSAFNEIPVVMCSVTTENTSNAVAGRVYDITKQLFEFDLQQQEANRRERSAEEVIAYIAWEPSSGTIGGKTFEVARTAEGVNHWFSYIPFDQKFDVPPVFVADMQTMEENDPATIRWRNKDAFGVSVKIEEERSQNNEVNHKPEIVGYLVIE